MSKIGKRVQIDSETLFKTVSGQQGVVLAQHPINSSLYRVALDNGTVGDFPSIVLGLVESDVADELTRPPLPAVQTETDQKTASIMAARVFQIVESNRVEILEVEAQIKAAQDEIARKIRATYPDLYESQRVSAIVFAQHEARIQAGAEVVWQSKGKPASGKTYGAAQIASEWRLVHFDPEAALAYARTQAPNLITTSVDPDRFTKAVKAGTLTNVPEEVCKWVDSYTVKTLKKVLQTLPDQIPPSDESE